MHKNVGKSACYRRSAAARPRFQQSRNPPGIPDLNPLSEFFTETAAIILRTSDINLMKSIMINVAAGQTVLSSPSEIVTPFLTHGPFGRQCAR